MNVGAARRAHSARRTPSCARRRGQHRPCWPRSDGVSALERGRALDSITWTPQTLVSTDTSQTLLRHVQTLLRHSKRRFRQLRCVGRVYQCQSCQTQTLWTLLTRPTRLETHVSPHKSPRMPTVMLGMQPMGSLGGSYPWPWPFGTTTPSTSAVGRHPDTSDTVLTPLTLRH